MTQAQKRSKQAGPIRSPKPAAVAVSPGPAAMILGLFSRIDALGLDAKETALKYLAQHRLEPNYPRLVRLGVAALEDRGIKLSVQECRTIEPKPEAPAVQRKASKPGTRGAAPEPQYA